MTIDEWIESSGTIVYGVIMRQEITWIRHKDRISFDLPPDTSCFFDENGNYDVKYNFCIPVTLYYVKITHRYKSETKQDTLLIVSDFHSNCYKVLFTGYEYLFYLDKRQVSDFYDKKIFSSTSECTRISLGGGGQFIEVEGKKINEQEYLEKRIRCHSE
jgi:hypothetical protein